MLTRIRRTICRVGPQIILGLLSCLLLAGGSARAAGTGGGKPRLVVLGFDGADARLVEQWMESGDLPNLSRLKAEGTYARLMPTNPPQTPVSWSAFATGLNPGRTEIFDFLKRVEGTYLPDFAMATPTHRDVLLGPRNPLVLGLGLAIALGGLLFLVIRLFGVKRLTALTIGLAMAATVAAPLYVIFDRDLPKRQPWARNGRQGTPVWKVLEKAGLKASILRLPVTFPAEEIRGGHMLSGLGVPDMRGGIGTPTLYTTDPARDPADNEFAVRVVLLEDDGGPSRAGDRAGLSYVSDVVGPDNLPFHDYAIEMAGEGIESRDLKRQAERHMEDRLKARGVPKVLKLPLNIQVDRERKTVTVSASGQEWTLRPGQWSGWTTFTFPVNWLVNRLNPVEGAARFYLLSVEPELNLYLAPLNFHPDFHPVPFSYPAGWASKLARRFGLFKTLGWAIDTWTMSAGLAGEKFTLSDLHATEEKYGQMMEHLLAESDDDLYVQIFTGPDRAGHMLWRLMDPGHPLYDSEVADRWGGALKEVYMQMDRIVGRAMNLLPEGSTLIVCSDHGFSSYRRGINYNTWLARKGFMTLASRDGGYGETKTLEDLFHGGTFFENVDWSRTKAYAMGLGEIYINLEGREPQGVVRPGDEYEQVRDAIVRGLESFVDPATGQHPVHRVYRREEIYSRFNAAIVPDLRASNNLGYRVEWQTALGGFTPEIVSDNLKLWSGDHCSLDPQFVKGILFINRPLQLRDPGIVDLAPTMLDILGVPPPSGLDGVSLLSHSRVARR